VILLSLACLNDHHAFFDDNLDPVVDFEHSAHEGLSTPYVRGTLVDITASLDGVRAFTSVSLVSSDPEVLDVVDHSTGDHVVTATVRAAGEGEARIELRDEHDQLLDARVVEVALPESITLEHEHTRRTGIEGGPDFALATGGSGRYLATYLDDEGRRLAGSAVLSAHAPAWALNAQTDTAEDADWITLDARAPAATELRLRVDGELIETRFIEVVDSDDVVAIRVEQESDIGRSSAATVHAWGVGELPDGTEVHGLDVVWSTDDGELWWHGDTLSYHPDGPVTPVFATVGEVGGEGSVRVSGFVHPTGCSATGLGASSMLVLLGLLAVRRR